MRFLHKNCLFGPYYTTYRYVASFLYSFLPGLLGQCISETYRQPRSQVLSLASRKNLIAAGQVAPKIWEPKIRGGKLRK